MKKTILWSMYNFKGGVGKTTAVHNIGYLLSVELGKKVLMVDLDPQCSLTGLVHYDLYARDPEKLKEHFESQEASYRDNKYTNVYDLFRRVNNSTGFILTADTAKSVQIDDMKMSNIGAVDERYNNLYLMPGDIRLGRIEKEVTLGFAKMGVYTALPGYITNIFREIGKIHNFDIILFDLNPNLGGFNQAVLLGSDYFSMPFMPDFFSFQAMQTLTSEIPSMYKNTLKKFRSTTLYDHDATPDPIACINSTPKFLGAFPQKIKTLGKDKLQQSTSAWIQQVHRQAKKLVEELKKDNMIASNFKYQEIVGVIDYTSTGHDVQASGKPISDLQFQHKHITKVNANNGLPSTTSFDTSKNKIKLRVHHSYRKILAILLGNLEQADLNQLFTPAQKERIGILQYSSEGIHSDFIPLALPPSDSNVQESERWYTDDDIQQLLHHYFDNKPHIQVLPAGRLHNATLRENIRQFISNIREPNSAQVRLLIPLNISANTNSVGAVGNHWVLIYIRYDQEDKKSFVFYFDPLGNTIHDQVNAMLHEVLGETIEIVPLEYRVQENLLNCGPWIVEGAVGLVNDSKLPYCDITDKRKTHQQILNQIRQRPVQPIDDQISLRRHQEMRHYPSHSVPVPVSQSTQVVEPQNVNNRTVPNEVLRGLTFQAIPGDGNCLFNAVGLYLGQDVQFLRSIVAAHLQENTADFEPYYAEKNKNFSQHIKDIREGHEWGTHIEIEVIQRLTNRPIIIIRSDANPTIPDNLSQYQGLPIFVYYNGRDHYHAFIIQAQQDPKAILERIQAQMAQGKRVTYNRDMTQLCEHPENVASIDPRLSSASKVPIIPSFINGTASRSQAHQQKQAPQPPIISRINNNPMGRNLINIFQNDINFTSVVFPLSNSLFDSINDQLKCIPDFEPKESGARLRRLAVDHIREKPSDYSLTNPDQYLRQMFKDTTPGGENEIKALAAYLNIKIKVFNDTANKQYISEYGSSEATTTIYLLRNPNDTYSSLRREGAEPIPKRYKVAKY